MLLVLVAMIAFIGFAAGATVGAEAQANESLTVTDAHENITEARVEIRDTLWTNGTYANRSMYTMAGPIISITLDMAHVGVNFGYEYPAASRTLADNITGILIVAAALPVIGIGRVFLRRYRIL